MFEFNTYTHPSKYWTWSIRIVATYATSTRGMVAIRYPHIYCSGADPRPWPVLLCCAILCRVNVRYRSQANKALLRLTLTHQMLTTDGAHTHTHACSKEVCRKTYNGQIWVKGAKDPHLVVSLFIISSLNCIFHVHRHPRIFDPVWRNRPGTSRLSRSSSTVLRLRFPLQRWLHQTQFSTFICSANKLGTFFAMTKVCSGNNLSRTNDGWCVCALCALSNWCYDIKNCRPFLPVNVNLRSTELASSTGFFFVSYLFSSPSHTNPHTQYDQRQGEQTNQTYRTGQLSGRSLYTLIEIYSKRQFVFGVARLMWPVRQKS